MLISLNYSKQPRAYLMEGETIEDVREAQLKPPTARTANRARIVQTGPVTYEFAPRNVQAGNKNPYARRVGAAGEAWLRRIKARQNRR